MTENLRYHRLVYIYINKILSEMSVFSYMGVIYIVEGVQYNSYIYIYDIYTILIHTHTHTHTNTHTHM
jgi:sRNA-binding regulator protein Hfq